MMSTITHLSVSSLFRSIGFISLTSLIAVFPAQAQEKMTEDAKKEAMEWIKQVEAGYLSESALRIKRAEAAILTACGSENAAMNLYVEAMKSRMLNTSSMVSRMFSSGRGVWMMGARGAGRNGGGSSNNNQSPSSMFSAWRKANTGSNARPGLKKALQLQFKWLLLTIKKSEAEKREQDLDVRGSVMTILDEYVANAKDVAEAMSFAASSAGIVREHLDIADLRPQKMPDSLSNIEGIYAQVLCEPYKTAKDIEGLRKMWQKRIASELAILNALNANNKDTKNSATEAAHFMLKRQMERERECYEIGDEVQAVNNLKKIIVTMREPSDKQSAIKMMKDMVSGKKAESSAGDRQGGRSRR